MDASSANISLAWKEFIPLISGVEKSIAFCQEYGLLHNLDTKNGVDCGAEKSVNVAVNYVKCPNQLWCNKCKKRTRAYHDN